MIVIVSVAVVNVSVLAMSVTYVPLLLLFAGANIKALVDAEGQGHGSVCLMQKDKSMGASV
jgi:hypothetical protein